MTKNKGSWLSVVFASVLLGVVADGFIIANRLADVIVLVLFIFAINVVIMSPLPNFLKRPLELSFFILTCYHYFNFGISFSWNWFKLFFAKLLEIFQGNYQENYQHLPENLALVLFLIALMIFCELILVYRHWQIPYFFSLSYLFILIFANDDDLTFHFIIASVVGVGLIYTLVQGNKLNWRDKLKRLLSFGLILALSFFAWHLPQMFPTFHQQVQQIGANTGYRAQRSQWYQRLTVDTRGAEMGFLGYSEDDRRLGGALQTTSEPAFEALSNNAHYWRVMSKEIYNGKGWESSQFETFPLDPESLAVSPYPKNTSTKGEQIELKLAVAGDFVPRPSGKIVFPNNAQAWVAETLSFAPQPERLYLNKTETELSYNYFPPTYTSDNLNASQTKLPGSVDSQLYLQLPTNLPQRVRELAISLTAEAGSDYQKVKAIETYLSQSAEFKYSLTEVEAVPLDQDFVDHFLFDSKVGYCEHYSTAMVVLARSLNIPARWTKGFAPGEVKEKLADGRFRYEITQENAHAWPEIYFSGIGWVPFEPTKTFAAESPNQNPVAGAEATAETPTAPTTEGEKPAETISTTEGTTENTVSTEANQEQGPIPASASRFNKVIYLYASLAGLLLISFSLWKIREGLAWFFLLSRVGYWPNYSFSRSFQAVLKRLAKITPRAQAESLSAYRQRLIELEPEFATSLSLIFNAAEEFLYSPTKGNLKSRDFYPAYQEVAKLARSLNKKINKKGAYE